MANNKIDIELKLKDKFSAGANKASKDIKGIGDNSRKSSKDVDKLSKSGINLGTVLKAAVVALVAKQIFNIGRASLRAAAQLEQYKTSFEVMLGSASKASALLKEINQVAVKTPFEQTEIIKSTQSLLAFGVAQEEVIPTFKILGDISQGNAEKLERLTRAYGKVQAKGKASMEEIQMTAEAGVPIIQALADSMDITKEEVFKLSSQGKISSEIFNNAMRSMTEEGGQFFGSMEKQSQTLDGQLSTFRGNVELLAQNFGQLLLPAAKVIVSWLNKLATVILESQQYWTDLAVAGELLGGTIDLIILKFQRWIDFIKNTITTLTGFWGALKDGISGIREFIAEQREEEAEAEAEYQERRKEIINNTTSSIVNLLKSEADANENKNKKIEKDNKKSLAQRLKEYLTFTEEQKKASMEALSFITQGTRSSNKTIFEIGKAAAIAKATINTYQAATNALANVPFPFNFGAAAAITAVGLDNVNQISQQQPQLASGGVVGAVSGGRSVTVAEGGADEAVLPLDDEDAAERVQEAAGGGTGDLNLSINIDGQAIMATTITNYNQAKSTGTLEVDFK